MHTKIIEEAVNDLYPITGTEGIYNESISYAAYQGRKRREADRVIPHFLTHAKTQGYELVKVDKWLSVTYMPKDLGFYLCFLIEVNDLGISRYIDMVWFNGKTFDSISVTHWQPLPEPPKTDL